ncbi:MAG: cyclophilin-like fold protein [Candidatus Competibacterales bacterium]|nr:cyclophilin-like fold protein [Candidatus Competibacterales bacterium]
MQRIKISWPQGQATAELRDTPSARALVEHLPVEGTASTWGDEVYFRVPFTVEREADAAEVVDKGAVCYWLDGQSLALPFGPTPVSRGDECRLISEANVLGRIEGDAEVLRSVRGGDQITVEAIQSESP